MRTIRWFVVSILALAVVASGCSSPTSPTGGTVLPPVVTSYVGVIAVTRGVAQSGKLTLVSTVPGGSSGDGTATGTVTLENAAPVGLIGTFNRATASFTMAGSGYQFTARVSSDSEFIGTGSLTLPNGTAPRPGGIETTSLPPTPMPVGVAGFASNTVSPAVTWRGSYTGNYISVAGSEREAGQFYFTMSGRDYGGNRYRVEGWAPTSGETSPNSPTQIQIVGTAALGTGDTPSNIIRGAIIDMFMLDPGGGTPPGTITGSWFDNFNVGIVGTYSLTAPPGLSRGSWRVYKQ